MHTSKSPHITQIQRNRPNYPIRLLDLNDPPNSLYIYGDIRILDLPMIAIVGSRAASQEGIKNAYFFARALSEAGFLIISGLARGLMEPPTGARLAQNKTIQP
jgi:DNA processing protein